MQNEKEATPIETNEQAVAKRPWQTPDFEEVDVQDTASAPPVTGGGDGPFLYS